MIVMKIKNLTDHKGRNHYDGNIDEIDTDQQSSQ